MLHRRPSFVLPVRIPEGGATTMMTTTVKHTKADVGACQRRWITGAVDGTLPEA